MKHLHKLKQMLNRELEEMSSKGEISAGSLDAIHKLTDTVKNIDKIIALEESSGYSGEGDWEARGSYRGGSYTDGGYSGRRRGGMGRYARDGGESDDDGSYRSSRRSYRGGYSGHGKEEMIEQMEELMEEAGSEKERQKYQMCLKHLREM